MKKNLVSKYFGDMAECQAQLKGVLRGRLRDLSTDGGSLLQSMAIMGRPVGDYLRQDVDIDRHALSAMSFTLQVPLEAFFGKLDARPTPKKVSVTGTGAEKTSDSAMCPESELGANAAQVGLYFRLMHELGDSPRVTELTGHLTRG